MLVVTQTSPPPDRASAKIYFHFCSYHINTVNLMMMINYIDSSGVPRTLVTYMYMHSQQNVLTIKISN